MAELEKIRVGGLFSLEANEAPAPAMRKSAQRKRFGIYYTPPDFRSRRDAELTKAIYRRVRSLGSQVESQ